MEKQNKKQKEHYAEKELNGILLANRKKSRFQMNKTISRMMSKVIEDKPDVDGTRVNWGKVTKNKKRDKKVEGK